MLTGGMLADEASNGRSNSDTKGATRVAVPDAELDRRSAASICACSTARCRETML